MKHSAFLLTAAIFCAAVIFPFCAFARTALLVTHYGSSDDTTRLLTIDRITADIKAAIPSFEVREAYISPVVRANLKNRGIIKDSPVDALLRLHIEGFDTVFVQSTTIIDGSEMADVRKAVDMVSPFFSFIKVGTSLLHSPADCLRLVDILSGFPCAQGESVIYVGHGNILPSTATYTQLDYMFARKGLSRFHVSTIEGYPDIDATLDQLALQPEIQSVTLLPLLLVCGNHTKNDIARDFSSKLRAHKYQVRVVLRGLAELPEVRKLYVLKALELILPD